MNNSIFEIATKNKKLPKETQLALWRTFNEARELVTSANYPFTQDGIKGYFENIPTRSQQEMAARCIRVGLKAKDKLIFSLQAMVIKQAKYFENAALDFNEMCQICNLGVMRALYKFNDNKNTKFSSYAEFWIKAEVYSALYRVNPIYVPKKILDEMDQFRYRFVSTNAEGQEIEYKEDIPRCTTLNEIMSQLTDTEQDIISDSFGLDGNTTILTAALFNGWTLEETQKRIETALDKARGLAAA
ncbi:MAG: sigma factor [Xenococcus sp. (in: cyanobacteria)]